MTAARQIDLPLQEKLTRPRQPPRSFEGVLVERGQARSILTRSRVPTMDLAINPYTGCGFGCSYCYAVFMCRSLGRPVDDWGRVFRAKTNLREVLGRELRRHKGADARIFISSVTDPYQPVEKELRLTRAALEELDASRRKPARVMVMTKSPLVLRDADLLGRLKADVGVSLAPLDDELGPFLEPRSPPIEARLRALKGLVEAGVKTYAFVGPIFPHLSEQPARVERLFEGVYGAGTREVYVAWLNLRHQARQRLLANLRGAPRNLVAKYYLRPDGGPKQRLEPFVLGSLKKLGLKMRTDRIIDH